MKRIFLLLTAVTMVIALQAQNDSTAVKILKKNVVTVVEDSVGTTVKVGDDGGIEVVTNQRGDTVRVRIGRRTIDVVETPDGTKVNTDREPPRKKEGYGNFNGHWGGFEIGVNTFSKAGYLEYAQTGYGEFFDLNYGKSVTVNLNVAEFAFSNEKQTLALLTGLGFSFMDFSFDQPITIAKEGTSGRLIPVQLNAENLKKSKLNVTYLTAPLILEIATPLKLNSHRLTLAAGVIGGINIGSHTKVKYSKSKDKERGNFHLNPLKYELTGRLGLGEFCLFANYGMTPLFKNEKGPELYPLTVGISFPNVNF